MKQASNQTEMNELDKQIQALRNEHEFKAQIKEALPDFKYLAFLTGHDKEGRRICVDCKNSADFKAVLSKFQPTNTNTVIGTVTDKYFSDLLTPFKLNIKNPCKPSQSNNFELTISYISGEIDVQCSLPISEVDSFVSADQRGVTDSEYHWFVASYSELQRMRVRCYKFNHHSQINWYGGDKTLTDLATINEIISHLSNQKL